jgi:hypothetical protein
LLDCLRRDFELSDGLFIGGFLGLLQRNRKRNKRHGREDHKIFPHDNLLSAGALEGILRWLVLKDEGYFEADSVSLGTFPGQTEIEKK